MFTKCNIGASSGKSTALTKDAIFALTTYDGVTAVHLMPLWSCWGSHVQQLVFHDKLWPTHKLNLL
jgi:hypothetical protein